MSNVGGSREEEEKEVEVRRRTKRKLIYFLFVS
jgi:hypothetical protein